VAAALGVGGAGEQINLNIANINKTVNMLGIPNRDSPEVRHNLAETINATRKLALETNKIMKEYADLAGKDAKETRKQKVKFQSDFESCLNRFQEVAEIAKKKSSTSIPPSSQSRTGGAGGITGAVPYHDDDDDEERALLDSRKREQLMALDQDSSFVSSMIDDRAQDINSIAASIEEINGIFVDLAQLVNEQAPMIDNIEANISSAERNVGKGVGELRSASGYADSARTKMCCIIVVILIIVGIVVGALVLGISFGLNK